MTIVTLERAVVAHLEEGFETAGGIMYVEPFYFQAVVLNKDK